MLTRIEVDGFKNLLGFSAEFGTFTCIAGPNAVGKSNLFDAIEFLSLLAEYPLEEAASRLRSDGRWHESSRNLFWTNGEVWAERICIAVEFIAGGLIYDDLGRDGFESNVVMRYEIELGFHGGRLQLQHERLIALGYPEAKKSVGAPHHASYRDVLGLWIERVEDRVIFNLAAGVMPRGEKPPVLAQLRRTLLSHYRTLDFKDVLVAGKCIRAWRRLELAPQALREPCPVDSDDSRLGRSGENFPSFVRSLALGIFLHVQFYEGQETDLWTAFSAEVASGLLPIASLRGLDVEVDDVRGLLTLHATLRNGERVPARALSEGTLRYLALFLIGRSPGTLWCIEEPENGMHPQRIIDVAALLRESTTDLRADISEELAELHQGEEFPLRQIIINTHSDKFVRETYGYTEAGRRKGEDLLMATSVLLSGPDGQSAEALRLHPILDTWRCRDGRRGVRLPVLSYLELAEVQSSSAAEEQD